MFHHLTPFQMLILDLRCAISTAPGQQLSARANQSIMILSKIQDDSPAHWISHPCPPATIEPLLVEAKLRGFHAAPINCCSKPRAVRARVHDALFYYRQRRIGRALVAHRAAQRAVFEAGGLALLYANAGLQLHEIALKFNASIIEIRRAERFSKLVRQSAHHALLARELGVIH